MHIRRMKTPATFTARVLREGEWFFSFSPEFPKGKGQGLTQNEALESLREYADDASLGSGEKLIPLAVA